LRKRALFSFASQNPSSSGDTHTAFAVEAFLDEIAVEAYFRRHCRKRLNADSGTPLMRKTGRWRIAPVKHDLNDRARSIRQAPGTRAKPRCFTHGPSFFGVLSELLAAYFP